MILKKIFKSINHIQKGINMKRTSMIISILLIAVMITTLSFAQDAQKFPKTPIYKFSAKTIDGEDISLEKFKGKVLLIVNVASKCGYTPQYKGLQELYDKYKSRGFEILAFPCNQFRGQEPGTNTQIKDFCSAEYGVTFPLFSKIEVNGEEALPLYQFLTNDDEKPILWNFEKFIVGFNGIVVQRFGTKIKPEELIPEIERQLELMNK